MYTILFVSFSQPPFIHPFTLHFAPCIFHFALPGCSCEQNNLALMGRPLPPKRIKALKSSHQKASLPTSDTPHMARGGLAAVSRVAL
jgi:hypothetical protein